MKCPHCNTGIHPKNEDFYLERDTDGGWSLVRTLCSECKRFSFVLVNKKNIESGLAPITTKKEMLVWPKGIQRDPVPAIVPQRISDDYNEACLVLQDSPKASAALSRRCLQHLLREHATIKEEDGSETTIKHGNLAEEIQQVLNEAHLPSYLAHDLDTIRNIGNFAAHPMKSTNSGEIIDVELGEAEWNLDVLESLFDFYFVRPDEMKRKRDKLNTKLGEAGKPALKSPGN